MNLQKQPRIKSKKITDSARGENCTLRIPGICNFEPKTTICAHINGAGMAYKSHDPLTAYTCSNCHTWLDGAYKNLDLSQYSDRQLRKAIRDSEQLRGIEETFPQLFQKGLIKL